MNVSQLDQRIDKDIRSFEKSLQEYDKLLAQASDLNSNYEERISGLTQDYKQKIAEFYELMSKDKEMTDDLVDQGKQQVLEIFNILNEIQDEKKDFEAYRRDLEQSFKDQWEIVKKENNTGLSDLREKINVQLNDLDANVSGELMRTEQQIVSARNEMTGIRKEILMLLSKELGDVNERSKGISVEVNQNKNDLRKLSDVLISRISNLEDKSQEELTNMKRDILLLLKKEVGAINQRSDSISSKASKNESDLLELRDTLIIQINGLGDQTVKGMGELRKELLDADRGLAIDINNVEKETREIRAEFSQQLAKLRKNLSLYVGVGAVLFGALVILVAGGWL